MSIDRVTGKIVTAALKVHTALGPGLLESVYETCLSHELQTAGLRVERQVLMPIVYEGIRLERALRLDLVVEDTVVVELKATESLLPVFSAQLFSYPKLSGKPVGLLINFHVVHLREGIRRISNFKHPLLSSESSVPSVMGFSE